MLSHIFLLITHCAQPYILTYHTLCSAIYSCRYQTSYAYLSHTVLSHIFLQVPNKLRLLITHCAQPYILAGTKQVTLTYHTLCSAIYSCRYQTSYAYLSHTVLSHIFLQVPNYAYLSHTVLSHIFLQVPNKLRLLITHCAQPYILAGTKQVTLTYHTLCSAIYSCRYQTSYAYLSHTVLSHIFLQVPNKLRLLITHLFITHCAQPYILAGTKQVTLTYHTLCSAIYSCRYQTSYAYLSHTVLSHIFLQVPNKLRLLITHCAQPYILAGTKQVTLTYHTLCSAIYSCRYQTSYAYLSHTVLSHIFLQVPNKLRLLITHCAQPYILAGTKQVTLTYHTLCSAIYSCRYQTSYAYLSHTVLSHIFLQVPNKLRLLITHCAQPYILAGTKQVTLTYHTLCSAIYSCRYQTSYAYLSHTVLSHIFLQVPNKLRLLITHCAQPYILAGTKQVTLTYHTLCSAIYSYLSHTVLSHIFLLITHCAQPYILTYHTLCSAIYSCRYQTSYAYLSHTVLSHIFLQVPNKLRLLITHCAQPYILAGTKQVTLTYHTLCSAIYSCRYQTSYAYLSHTVLSHIFLQVPNKLRLLITHCAQPYILAGTKQVTLTYHTLCSAIYSCRYQTSYAYLSHTVLSHIFLQVPNKLRLLITHCAQPYILAGTKQVTLTYHTLCSAIYSCRYQITLTYHTLCSAIYSCRYQTSYAYLSHTVLSHIFLQVPNKLRLLITHCAQPYILAGTKQVTLTYHTLCSAIYSCRYQTSYAYLSHTVLSHIFLQVPNKIKYLQSLHLPLVRYASSCSCE